MDDSQPLPNPTDAETAEAMRELAEAFLTGSAQEGDVFGWKSDEAARLDDICLRFLRSKPAPDVVHSVIMSMGAYIGELLVRNHGGRWAYDAAERAAVVEMPNGLRAHPHNKVAKRLHVGAEHNLRQFYWYAVNRPQ